MQLNIEKIKKVIPHRYPFLLIDKIVEINILKSSIIAQKNITINEEFFSGHFPNRPIMPGVLIVETMAQAVGVLGTKIMQLKYHVAKNNKKLFVLAGIDRVRIKKSVVPGDILKVYASIEKIKQTFCTSEAVVLVENNMIASAKFIAVYKEH
jgi:3-hydroxyacyl-[acyl-carrier-protein] dehydratase